MKPKFEIVSDKKPCGDQPQAISALVDGINQKKRAQTLLGVTGSGKTFTIANVIEKTQKKTLILAHNKTLAAQLYAEFKEIFPHNAVEYFVSYYDYYQPEAYIPGTDTYIEKDSAINDEIDKLRHSATRSILERDDVIVVASVSAIYGIGSPREYEMQKIILLQGDRIDRDDLLKKLVERQYERNDIEFSRGTFRVRGDILDIFPSHEDNKIIRLEFFGDELEKILLLDPLKNKEIVELKNVTIYPKSHYVVGTQAMDRALTGIKEELCERLQFFAKENKLLEKQRLETKTLHDIEMLEEMGFCTGIENYSRHLTGNLPGEPPPTLMDYFKKDFLLVIDESHITVSQVSGMFFGDRSRKETLVEHGFRLPSALDNRPLNFKEFQERIDQVIFVSATPAEYEIKESQGEIIEQVIRPTGLVDPIVEIKDAANQVDDLLKELKVIIAKKQRALVTTLTKKLSEELTKYLEMEGIKVKYLHSDIDTLKRIEILNELRSGDFDVLVGINLLREGLDLPEVSFVAILDADKEGFLRSERSLIQTIGRAARHVDGRVVLYAYKETKSIKKAVEETRRRRVLQEEYNKKHGITPTSIQKKISGGVVDLLRKDKEAFSEIQKKNKIEKDDIDAQIIILKKKMKQASRELRFEDAIRLREEIRLLSEAKLFDF